MELSNFINNNSLCVILFTSNNFNKINNSIKNINEIKNKLMIIYVNDTNKNEDIFITSIPLVHIYKNKKLIEEIFGNYMNICDIIKLHF